MTQNNRNQFNDNYTNENNNNKNFNYALHRARIQQKRIRDARYATARTKVMSIVLAIALAASAITAVIVTTIKVNENRAAAAKNTAAVTAQLKEAQPQDGAVDSTIAKEAPKATEAPKPTEAPKATEAAKTGQNADPKLGAVTEILTAQGKTSYGYNWAFKGCSVAKIHCTYDFGTNTYHFTAQGITPGTDTATLRYMTGDSQWAEKQVTITVDNALNVTVR